MSTSRFVCNTTIKNIYIYNFDTKHEIHSMENNKTNKFKQPMVYMNQYGFGVSTRVWIFIYK